MLADFFAAVEAAVVALGASPWLVLVVFAFCGLDAVFPIVPSDSMVTAATVVALAQGVSWSFIVLLVVSGAFLGDCLAYVLGSKIPLERMPLFRRRRPRAALRFTQRAFAQRGSTLILAGRFIPAGRIAVNMTAGATGFAFRRFVPLVALAGVLWASLAAAMGIIAEHVFEDRPLVAVIAGVGMGIGCGLLIDWFLQRRRQKPAGSA
ncbi:MAG TPA: VTT domain-containing protein [Yaniella sp.]